MSEPFVTKRGYEIHVQSFPHLLPGKVQVGAEKKAKKLFPAEVPTYDEPLMGGGVQTFEHDEKSIEGNPEATAAYNLYQENMRKQISFVNEKMMQFYIIEGTNVQLPSDDSWRKRQEFYGIEIPDDETELLYHYITTVMLADTREVMSLVERIMEASGIDSDTLSAARRSFRGILGEEEDTTGRPDGDAEGRGEANTLVHEPSLSGNGSYGEMADTAINMG